MNGDEMNSGEVMGKTETKIKRKKRAYTKMQKGGRNLVIMGIISVLIALSTTGVSLAIYHNSGDIYLDRSRPGYLPDEEEIEDENDKEEEDYEFGKSGKLTEAELKDFLENLDIEVKAIDEYEKPFNEGALSDERLGIPAAIEEEKSAE